MKTVWCRGRDYRHLDLTLKMGGDVLMFHLICSAGLKLNKGKGKGTTVPSHAIKACVQRKRRYR